MRFRRCLFEVPVKTNVYIYCKTTYYSIIADYSITSIKISGVSVKVIGLSSRFQSSDKFIGRFHSILKH